MTFGQSFDGGFGFPTNAEFCNAMMCGTAPGRYLGIVKIKGVRMGGLVSKAKLKVYENHSQDSHVKPCGERLPQLNAQAGTGGCNLPLVVRFHGCLTPNHPQTHRVYGQGGAMPSVVANSNGGQNQQAVLTIRRSSGFKAGNSAQARSVGYGEESATSIGARMSATEPTVVTFRTRTHIGFDSKGHCNGASRESSPTIRAGGFDRSHANGGVPPAVVAFKIDALASNSMKSRNPESGIHRVSAWQTIDTSSQSPTRNQGGAFVLVVRQGKPGGGQGCAREQGKVAHAIDAQHLDADNAWKKEVK